ncbi:hypothetical protein RFI_04773 [Reticulomyxa filosa]|uniref:NACHT domain-containing protein n=1 Tax=Reticulomyxa filosa TaxID=46433 RepID=X6P2N3_RETFI|nr:hypothetical protein RFI_04773 [Reticulomyxa filosa]|eukprot:ETO32344.1 hypothetical protein RFI_04773 [Reticulomyxa filosa]
MSGQIEAKEDLLNEKKNDNGKTQNENEQLSLIKKKLKRYYQSQDKLVPLFDDFEQSINTRKWKMANSLDYSLIYGNQTKNIELQDIWNDKQKESKVCYISIRGEAGSGKSVLSQRITYLWGNHQFQSLLYIPLRKTINAFHHINDNNDDQKKDENNCDIEYL